MSKRNGGCLEFIAGAIIIILIGIVASFVWDFGVSLFYLHKAWGMTMVAYIFCWNAPMFLDLASRARPTKGVVARIESYDAMVRFLYRTAWTYSFAAVSAIVLSMLICAVFPKEWLWPGNLGLHWTLFNRNIFSANWVRYELFENRILMGILSGMVSAPLCFLIFKLLRWIVRKHSFLITRPVHALTSWMEP